MNESVANFARIVIPSRKLEALVYAIPEELKGSLCTGARVLIPLGKRKLTGIAIELLSATSITQIRPIIALLDLQPILDEKLIRLIHWISRYYLASLGEVLTAVLPPGLRVQSEEWVRLKVEAIATTDPLEDEIIRLLRQRSSAVTVKYLARHVHGANLNRVLSRLERAGVVERRERLRGQRRRPKIVDLRTDHDGGAAISLTAEQNAVLQPILARINDGGFETFLLHGVTGSGKTEVYLRAIEKSRALQRRSLILIPEISLTTQLLDRVSARFPGRVGILHSGLTGAQRSTQWWKIVRGEVDVVIGARSAVFAPLADLGLIIVDEEHEPSYKQEEGLRYNGRDIAIVRGKISDCSVLLGSATPSIETYENTLRGRYKLLEMAKRVHARPLPTIETIDLRRQEPVHGNFEGVANRKANNAAPGASFFFSEPLANALVANFKAHHQSLLFLNRRGFSNFLQCRGCGHVLRCMNCSVTLTLHRKESTLRCHHCDFQKPIIEICPDCGGTHLREIGVGTEQIEATLKVLAPSARVARMDADTTGKRGSQEALIRSWERGDIDILVGTQMIAKGHDVTGVTLVGAVLADLSLNLPDFRAAERTYQLLSQVAGRSGRGEGAGHVIIQTYSPDHYAIQNLVNHDYKNFFRAEMTFRRALNYPPFSRLVQFHMEGPKADEVEFQIKQLGSVMRRELEGHEKLSGQIEILGPAPAPIEKIRNRFRWHLLIKGKRVSTLLEFARKARAGFAVNGSTRLHVDVDPCSML